MFRIGDFFVIAFAVFAITVLAKDTAGPFNIFLKVRDWLVGSDEMHPRMFFMDLLACPWCMATWISVVVNLVYLFVSHCSVFVFFVYWLGTIGVTGFLYAILYSVLGDD